MTDANITKEIIEQLTEIRDPNDIILDICVRYRMSWPEAEALVRQVQTENQDTVTLRNAPLLTVVALVTFISGLVLLAIGLYTLALLAAAVIVAREGGNIFSSWEFYFSVNTMVRTGLQPLAGIPIGFAMMLGSLLGMRDVWAVLLPRLMSFFRNSDTKGQ